MYLSIHSIYDVNLQQTSKKLQDPTSNKNPSTGNNRRSPLGIFRVAPKWRAVPGGPGVPALQTENLKELGHGGRVGPCLPKLGDLVSKQQRQVRKSFFSSFLGG